MSNRMKQVGVVVCLMAMSAFAGWPFWQWFGTKAVSASLRTRTQALVEKNPQLRPAWEIALQDEVLTYPEAKVIVEAAGEKVSPNE